MSIVFNQDLLADDPGGDGPSSLPEGVFLAGDWAKMAEDKSLPADRQELFTVNGRVYTAPKRVDHRVVFQYMKSVRNGDSEQGMANALYGVLGDAVMDVLATEELSPDEFRTVMKVVERHLAGSVRRTLGN